MTLTAVLDAPGGVAGDMFQAAMLDALPDLETGWRADLAAAGLSGIVEPQVTQQRKNGFAARQVRFGIAAAPPALRHWADIRDWLGRSGLEREVRDTAVAIFARLAEAEAKAHGIAVEAVHFHEVSDWDSVADIVGAASLIVRSGIGRWTVGPLPMGSGHVDTAHGRIALPAPATLRLLTGFDLFRDGIPGERITPTGAAILAHLVAPGEAARPGGRIAATGNGAGTKDLTPVVNLLTVTLLDATAPVARPDRIVRLAFEIDDMTPEELGVALDRIRAAEGIVDAAFFLRYGKKGRPQFAVEVLVRPDAADRACALCFAETSTLGLRRTEEERLILPRTETLRGGLRVKTSARPGGPTAKVESDDLALTPRLAARRALAREGERDDT